MSDLEKQLFEGLGNVAEAAKAMAPGLDNLVPEAGAELSRLGTQGAMELASALFGNGAFVPYGPGQYTPSVEKTNAEPDMEQGIEEHEQMIER